MTDDTYTLHHAGDPDTSRTAAASAVGREQVKQAILWLLDAAEAPLSAENLIGLYFHHREGMGWPVVQLHSIPRRLSELHNAGLVRDSGARLRNLSGRPAVGWVRSNDPAKPPRGHDTEPGDAELVIDPRVDWISERYEIPSGTVEHSETRYAGRDVYLLDGSMRRQYRDAAGTWVEWERVTA